MSARGTHLDTAQTLLQPGLCLFPALARRALALRRRTLTLGQAELRLALCGAQALTQLDVAHAQLAHACLGAVGTLALCRELLAQVIHVLLHARGALLGRRCRRRWASHQRRMPSLQLLLSHTSTHHSEHP